ncbi:MAG: hypothetical protein BYD32DRAFT_464395 [Podila humilis]|nr:MAG: hypothetical protein BYD32DRAFT_464395 [Podila humilis]
MSEHRYGDQHVPILNIFFTKVPAHRPKDKKAEHGSDTFWCHPHSVFSEYHGVALSKTMDFLAGDSPHSGNSVLTGCTPHPVYNNVPLDGVAPIDPNPFVPNEVAEVPDVSEQGIGTQELSPHPYDMAANLQADTLVLTPAVTVCPNSTVATALEIPAVRGSAGSSAAP